MASGADRAEALVRKLLKGSSIEQVLAGLAPSTEELPRRLPGALSGGAEAIHRRWDLLEQTVRPELWSEVDLTCYEGNIENLIGEVRVPVGIAGPLRVNCAKGHRDYYVPLATTEAALVASYSRGSLVVSESGGCSVLVLAEGVCRSPGFSFMNLREVAVFVEWVLRNREEFARAAEATTRYGRLQDLRVNIEGNHVYLIFEYTTGDAAGQNMVTIATQAIVDHIGEHSPVRPRRMFVEANLSGDKKASAQSFLGVRGRKVTAEVLIPAEVIRKRLHTEVATMVDYWQMSALGGVQSGTIGVQGHFANGLAALFLATGQDVACVSEAAVGITRFEEAEGGALYAAVTLPNVIVGSVGGGTRLPSQAACLDLLGLRGEGNASALAEVAAALALAGELSIIGALSAGQFTRAHRKLARESGSANAD